MSVQSIQSSISSVQREIESLNSRRSEKTRQEADKNSRIASIQRSVTTNTSASTLQSKQREIQSLQNNIVQIQRDRASIEKQIADKTTKLHRHQQDLYKEQEREQKKFQESLERTRQASEKRQNEALKKLMQNVSPPSPGRVTSSNDDNMQYDAFISHASEDKEAIARPLAEALRSHGHNIWYDEFELKVGDSLRRSIDRGLSRSKFGIVILSPSFFAKKWPQHELDGLVAKEMVGGKVILPIWHKLSKDEVLAYSPTLADKLALNTALSTIEELSQQLSDVLKDT